jgi:hypothetical protein
MKPSILLSFLFLFHGLTAQNRDSTRLSDVHNTRTGKHVLIAGTHVYLKAPKGYLPTQSFIGLEKTKGTGISVSDLPNNFFASTESFSKTELEKLGTKVLEFHSFQLNGYSAKMAFLDGKNNIREYSLIFGDSTFTCLLMGLFPQGDKEAEKEIQPALLSVVYDKNRQVDPLETAPFRVDEKQSVFKFARHKGSSYTFSLGGIRKEDYGKDAFMLFLPMAADSAKTLRTYSEETVVKMQQYGFSNFEIHRPSSENINGYPAYESEVSGSLRGEQSVTYLLVIQISKKQVILIEGIAKNEFENNLSEMKKLAHTIRSSE